VAIAECKPLNDTIGGEFSWKQLGEWLGFLDDVGFYYRRGALDYETVDHLFGGIILEAYVYAEIPEFIAGIESKGAEKGVLKDFLALGRKLSDDPDRSAQIALWKRDCRHSAPARKGKSP